ncbi:MAG: serine/threonine-protein kinase [Actinomycetota bacterium]
MADEEAGIDLGIRGLGPAEHIGRGGFADVYRAEQLSLRRTVAVKVLRAQASDTEAEARFQRECHAIGAVSDHPHIVGVHEGGFTRNGRAYLVMEYLPGGSLRDRLDELGPLPGHDAVEITVKIGRALAEAHRAGILHRDIKPANLMISAYGEPALGDFGIARIEGGHRTATGLVTASFAHAAPEVLEGQPPTVAADVYSLGTTMYELIVGHAPYHDPTDATVWPLMKRILSEPMPSPSSAGMSDRLGAAFELATARSPGDRYVTVDALVGDLVAALADPPVTVGMADLALPLDVAAGQPVTAREFGPPSAPLGRDVQPVPPTAATPDLFLPAADRPPAAPIEPWAELYQPPRTAGEAGRADRPAAGPSGWAQPAERVGSSSGAGSSRSLVTTLLIGLGVVAVLVGVGLWLRQGAGGASADATATIEGASVGPLEAGVEHRVSVLDAPVGAQFRPVVDGLATGAPGPDPVTVTLQPGRRTVAVEVTVGEEITTTEAIDVYAVGPSPAAGYHASLAAVDRVNQGWSEALAVFDRLVAEGHADLMLYPSDGVATLTPGYWALVVPGFGADASAAERYCQRFELSVPDRCHAAFLAPAT